MGGRKKVKPFPALGSTRPQAQDQRQQSLEEGQMTDSETTQVTQSINQQDQGQQAQGQVGTNLTKFTLTDQQQQPIQRAIPSQSKQNSQVNQVQQAFKRTTINSPGSIPSQQPQAQQAVQQVNPKIADQGVQQEQAQLAKPAFTIRKQTTQQQSMSVNQDQNVNQQTNLNQSTTSNQGRQAQRAVQRIKLTFSGRSKSQGQVQSTPEQNIPNTTNQQQQVTQSATLNAINIQEVQKQLSQQPIAMQVDPAAREDVQQDDIVMQETMQQQGANIHTSIQSVSSLSQAPLRQSSQRQQSLRMNSPRQDQVQGTSYHPLPNYHTELDVELITTNYDLWRGVTEYESGLQLLEYEEKVNSRHRQLLDLAKQARSNVDKLRYNELLKRFSYILQQITPWVTTVVERLNLELNQAHNQRGNYRSKVQGVLEQATPLRHSDFLQEFYFSGLTFHQLILKINDWEVRQQQPGFSSRELELCRRILKETPKFKFEAQTTQELVPAVFRLSDLRADAFRALYNMTERSRGSCAVASLDNIYKSKNIAGYGLSDIEMLEVWQFDEDFPAFRTSVFKDNLTTIVISHTNSNPAAPLNLTEFILYVLVNGFAFPEEFSKDDPQAPSRVSTLRMLDTGAPLPISIIICRNTNTCIQQFKNLWNCFGPMLAKVYNMRIGVAKENFDIPIDLPPPSEYEAKVSFCHPFATQTYETIQDSEFKYSFPVLFIGSIIRPQYYTQGLLGSYIKKQPKYCTQNLEDSRTYRLNFETNQWFLVETSQVLDEDYYSRQRGCQLLVKAVVNQEAYDKLDPNFLRIFDSVEPERGFAKAQALASYHLSHRNDLDHLLRFGKLSPQVLMTKHGMHLFQSAKTYSYRMDSNYDLACRQTTPPYCVRYDSRTIQEVVSKLQNTDGINVPYGLLRAIEDKFDVTLTSRTAGQKRR